MAFISTHQNQKHISYFIFLLLLLEYIFLHFSRVKYVFKMNLLLLIFVLQWTFILTLDKNQAKIVKLIAFEHQQEWFGNSLTFSRE